MPEHLMADIPQKVFLVHEGKVLLTREADGKWQPPGGRLNVGEQPEEGLRREIREEIGVEIDVKGIFDTFVFTSASGLAHYVVIYLAALQGMLDDLKPDSGEMVEIRWCGADAFDDLDMKDGYKLALEKYFHARTS